MTDDGLFVEGNFCIVYPGVKQRRILGYWGRFAFHFGGSTHHELRSDAADKGRDPLQVLIAGQS